MKSLKANIIITTRCYLVTVDAVSMCTNTLKEEALVNMKELLNEKFVHIAEDFPNMNYWKQWRSHCVITSFLWRCVLDARIINGNGYASIHGKSYSILRNKGN